MASKDILFRGPAVVALVLAVFVVGGEAQGRACQAGVPCQNIVQCRPMLDLLRTRTQEAFAKIRENICSVSGRSLSVCCQEVDVPPPGNGEDLLPKRCPASTSGRIIDGEEVPPGSMPFLALLGFSRRGRDQVFWACGGALINERYVVTAAHCLHTNFNGGLRLTRVVLGEHNYTTSPDCRVLRNGQRDCSPPEQVFSSFPSGSIIIHEDFAKRNALSDDIALIRLDRPVESSSVVNPICLPSANQDAKAFLNGRNATAAGWGLTSSPSSGNARLSTVPMGVKLPYFDRSACDPFITAYTLIDGQVCFGGTGKKDTCDGDSGGPVIGSAATGPPFFLLGVTSGGASIGECGTPGVPAVYTDVAYYRNWIASKLRP